MRDEGPLRGDWGKLEVQPDHVMRVTTRMVSLGNQGPTDRNPSGTEITIVVEGEPMLGTLRRAVLHFVRQDAVQPPGFDRDGTLRCWFDQIGLDIVQGQLNYPGVTLSFSAGNDGPNLAMLRTPQTRISVR